MTHGTIEPHHAPPSLDAPVDGTDMEVAITNMHQKMKNLESKYIDLANFYKKEMLERSSES